MFTKLIENVLTLDECDKIIKHALTLELDDIKTYNPNNGQNFIDLSFNKRKGVKFENNDYNEISLRILNIINQLKIYDGIEYYKLNPYLFNEYKETNFLNYHIDKAEIEDGASITVLYQLNDDYIGGEFCYKINDKEYVVPKIKGSVFIFESNILHKVKIVKSGCRYSLNNWPLYKKISKTLL